jgi:hypothetical protein
MDAVQEYGRERKELVWFVLRLYYFFSFSFCFALLFHCRSKKEKMLAAQGRLQSRLGAGTRAFLHLMEDGDVRIVCEDGTVLAPSVFLRARSSYFRKQEPFFYFE